MGKKVNTKVEYVLNANWVTFNRRLLKLNIKDLRLAHEHEKKYGKRGTFITRLEKRIRSLAAKAAI